MATKQQQPVIRTPEAVASYPHLFEAVAGPDGGEPKFSITLVFAEGTDLTELKRSALQAGIDFFGPKFEEGVRAGKYKWPFRTDDDKGYAKGSTFFAARTSNPPGVVDGALTPITADMQKVGNPSEVYPGSIVRATVKAYGYDNRGKGVTFALNNVQKLREGKRLDNRKPATEDFDKVMSEAPASMEEIAGDTAKSLLS